MIEYHRAVADLLQSHSDPSHCWRELLRLVGEHSPGKFEGIEIEADIHELAGQLRTIWSHEPIPPSVTFLYFGLYNLYQPSPATPHVGFYVSGGDGNVIHKLTAGNLAYLPIRRQLVCNVLDQIKGAKRDSADQADLLEYALMLGGAAIVSRAAVESLAIPLPVYAGFDSGDFVLASRQQ
jgi:hypothetical protein